MCTVLYLNQLLYKLAVGDILYGITICDKPKIPMHVRFIQHVWASKYCGFTERLEFMLLIAKGSAAKGKSQPE